MKRNFTVTDHGGGVVLKSIKLTEPLVKPEIKEAVVPVEQHVSEHTKKNIATKLIEKLKKIRDELFNRTKTS
ncbi:hypothetical protein CEY12_07735 [Chryseobacterium sp. T16E-39]|uniref:hypothetical protein n=1 Tax=Chryseobacterium sp. T16E-39 TaxID=2015076 RepID=UPI000B5B1D34|nr:hypothetical protein [Chryseobacterium sp. T16E-39]ASK30005.1 hypothetical protein CEY12_07735 [Chryseobacterium sp. T16E-39]